MPFVAVSPFVLPLGIKEQGDHVYGAELVPRLGMCDIHAEIRNLLDNHWFPIEQLNSSEFNFISLFHVLKLFRFYFSNFLSLLSELLLFYCLACFVLPSPASPGQNVTARKGSGESCSPRKGSIKDRFEWPRYKPLQYRDIATSPCDLFWFLIIPFHKKGIFVCFSNIQTKFS